MKYIFTLLIGLSLGATLAAQQAGQYSLYMFDPLQWNPAYAGLDHSLSLTGTYRRQWTGLEGSPASQRFSVHLPVYMLSGGFGLQLENESLGASRYTNVWLNYNYQMEVGAGLLSLGAGAGWVQWALDGDKLRTPGGNYGEPGVIDHQDDLLPLVTERGNTTSFSAGVYYQSEWLEGGISVENVTEPTIGLTNLDLRLARTYFAGLGVHFEVGRAFTVHPSVWARADGRQIQTDLSLIIRYNDNIFAGAAFRGYNKQTTDAVALIAGLQLNEHIRLAYAYDLTLSPLQNVQNGSHEISVNYNLNTPIAPGRPPRIIYNPRAR